MTPDRRNNFDFLRLLAATQVLLVHVSEHLRAPMTEGISSLISSFPGVPVFFAISGFLIPASYERSKTLASYCARRARRIFPALWAVVIGSIVTVLLVSPLSLADADWSSLFVWLVCQGTFIQVWNPSFLRDYGVGVLNGSLWTITVELQFYVVVAVLFLIFGRLSRRLVLWVWILFLLFTAISLLLRIDGLWMILGTHAETAQKVFNVTFIPHFYLFLFGWLLCLNWDRVVGFFAGRAGWWLLGYAATIVIGKSLLGDEWAGGNRLHPFVSIVLAASAISCAHTFVGFSDFTLRRQDISYGVYIWHMPIVNVFVELGMVGSVVAGFAIVLTFIAGSVSWIFVERPFLRKPRSGMNTCLTSNVASGDV